jgi:O-antigen ligase
MSGLSRKISTYINKISYFLLIGFAVVLPFSRLLLVVMMSLIIFLWLIKLLLREVHLPKNFLFYNIYLLIVLILASYIFISNRPQSRDWMETLLSPLLWFLAISSLPLSESQFKKVTTVSLISITCVITFQMIFYLLDPFKDRFIFLESPIHDSALISLVAILLFNLVYQEKVWAKKLVEIFFSFIIIISLFFSYTRGAWLGFLGGLIGIIFVTKNKYLIRFFIILIIFSMIFFLLSPVLTDRFQTIFSTEYSSNMQRIFIWDVALKEINKSPVFGIGMNMFTSQFNNYDHEKFIDKAYHAHNIYLQTILDLGLIGLVLYLLLFINLFVVIYKITRQSSSSLKLFLGYSFLGCLISYLTHGMVDYLLWIRPVTSLLLFLPGALISLENNRLPEAK